MATLKFKIDGLRELDRALSDLPKATGKAVLRRIGRAALDPMARAAANAAPIDEGWLAFSIGISEKRTRRARRKPMRVRVDGRWRMDRSHGIEMAMGPSAGHGALEYATFVEFGTVDTAAQPFMRPAWQSGNMRALQYITVNLGTEIGKSARRVAARAARKAKAG